MRELLHSRRVIVPVVILCAAALVLMGARFAAYPAVESWILSGPDHVHIVVTRMQLSPTSHTISHTVIFDHQSGSVASEIYAQLVAGERISPNTALSCAPGPLAYSYYHYDLTFSRAGIQTSVATSDATGCQVITLTYLGGDQDVFFPDAANGVSFWVRLHQLVNAPLPI